MGGGRGLQRSKTFTSHGRVDSLPPHPHPHPRSVFTDDGVGRRNLLEITSALQRPRQPLIELCGSVTSPPSGPGPSSSAEDATRDNQHVERNPPLRPHGCGAELKRQSPQVVPSAAWRRGLVGVSWVDLGLSLGLSLACSVSIVRRCCHSRFWRRHLFPARVNI